MSDKVPMPSLGGFGDRGAVRQPHYNSSSLFEAPPSSTFPRVDAPHVSRFDGADTHSVPPSAFDTNAAFGYDPTSLESSILSSMLHDVDASKPSHDSPDVPTVPAMDLMDNYTHISQAPSGDDVLGAALPSGLRAPSLLGSGDFGSVSSYNGESTPLSDPSLLGPTSVSPSTLERDHRVGAGLGAESQEALERRRALAARTETDDGTELAWRQRVAKVYRDDTKPFRYTEGYHILLKYATQKYEKADVLRIVRALAIYRPSLIALQMPLSEEDEIFVERAFQRTILEFEKLISFSGTPTVVWRRTCEIALVGAEFCMLTQWVKEDLLGKYIYQFMDKESVINYWELFASRAFENTTQSVMSKCVLLTPSGKSIPCTWCFTIKRDPFDLPGFVVGNVRGPSLTPVSARPFVGVVECPPSPP